jgi:hypothetical protein
VVAATTVRAGRTPVLSVVQLQQRVLVRGRWTWRVVTTRSTTAAGYTTMATPIFRSRGPRAFRTIVVTHSGSGWTSTTSPTRTITWR